MAVKKNELYKSLWASCDQLRGGMDASQYKDYVLILLFVKYVTDKFRNIKYADIEVPDGGSFNDIVKLKGKPNIGEGIDKVIGKLAVSNNLRGVIDNASFNDEDKLGRGKEMVDKLTELVAIFQRPEFDFKNNKTNGDDILGDAYEYLMRNFATESGKSKGQFYTPAEVSRVLAKIVGINKIEKRNEDYTIYDPACGSGSLLIKAADEAPEGIEVAIYGQEKDITTAGLAKMNMVLHNKATAIIAGNASTFSDPQFTDDSNLELRQFDFAVANPPFSLKNWTNGLKEYGRFDNYGERPPEKNGDYAWLLHILKSLKINGKAAIILPLGILFRGNSEAVIRKTIIDKGYIKGIIALPSNLFYGTGIPACIVVIDKSDAKDRKEIFMIDASKDYIKDGNKNRLRERDINKIVTTFNEQIVDDPKYARLVPLDEIINRNDYNLNIPRYIDGSLAEDIQDIDGHLNGGIPAADIDSMQKYWQQFPSLKNKLFYVVRKGYYQLNVPKSEIKNIIYNDKQFIDYADTVDNAFENWRKKANKLLLSIDLKTDIKILIETISKELIKVFSKIELVDKHDVYEVLLSYWQEVMSDDVWVLKHDGFVAGRVITNIVEIISFGKNKGKERVIGWDGKLIPREVIKRIYFSNEANEIEKAQEVIEIHQNILDDYTLEFTGEDGILRECLSSKDVVIISEVKNKIKEYKQNNKINEDYKILTNYLELHDKIINHTKIVKELSDSLEELIKKKYSILSMKEIKDLLINQKWHYSIFLGIKNLYELTSNNIYDRVLELSDRYESNLSQLENEVIDYERKVKSHLERMGFKW